jgi:hypothetical protein
MDPLDLLLVTAFRHVIHEANAEAACQRFQSITARPVNGQTFHEAVARALREGLVRDPIRLPEGALQCHWHLELTPAGVTAARAVLAIQSKI